MAEGPGTPFRAVYLYVYPLVPGIIIQGASAEVKRTESNLNGKIGKPNLRQSAAATAGTDLPSHRHPVTWREIPLCPIVPLVTFDVMLLRV